MYHIKIRDLISNIAIIPLVMCLMFSASAWAGNDCVAIKGDGNIYFAGPLIPGPDPVAFGTVIYTFPDAIHEGMVTAFLLEPPKYTEDGAIHMLTDVQHDFAGGDSLRWRLNIVLSPTDIPGEYRLNEHNMLVSGEGVYAEAFGRSRGHGSASFNSGQAQILAKGRLCGIAL